MSECSCRCYLAIDTARDIWEEARNAERAWKEGDQEGVRSGLEAIWSSCETLYAIRPGMLGALQHLSALIDRASTAIYKPDDLVDRNEEPAEVASDALTLMLDVAEKEIYLPVKADCSR